MTEQTTKMLERVRALLAKAEDRSVGEAEAQAFREKADELMTRHSISQWAVTEAQSGRDARVEPVRRDFARTWTGSKFRNELIDMFISVAEHCRCVAGWRGQSYKSVPVYGLPSDLDYLEVLFTTLQLEVARNMDPPVNPDGDLGEEVFKQRQAGISWPRITQKVYDAGLVSLSKAEFKKLTEQYGYRGAADELDPDDHITWEQVKAYDYDYSSNSDLGPVRTSIKNRLANANRSYIKRTDKQSERNYVKPEVYQRSFMMGFTSEIRSRIRRMSEASRRAYDADHDAGSMALAVRDIKTQAMELYKEEFPPPPPIEVDPSAKPVKGRAIKMREVRVDYGAMGKGRAAGEKANLSNNPSRRVGGETGKLNR